MMQIRLLPRTTMQVMTRPAAPAGLDGWTPVLAVVVDGLRRVQQVANWTGGHGAKPVSGWYVGVSGLVDSIALAVDIRGEPGDVTPAAAILLQQAQAAAADAGASKVAAAGSAQDAASSAASSAMSGQNASGSAASASTAAQNAETAAASAASFAQTASTSASNAVDAAQAAATSEISASFSATGAAAAADAAAAAAATIDTASLVARANNLSDLVNKNAALVNLGGGEAGISLFKAETADAAKGVLGRMGNADLADMPASTIKGVIAAGEPQDLTTEQVWALIGPAGKATPEEVAAGTNDSKFIAPAALGVVQTWAINNFVTDLRLSGGGKHAYRAGAVGGGAGEVVTALEWASTAYRGVDAIWTKYLQKNIAGGWYTCASV